MRSLAPVYVWHISVYFILAPIQFKLNEPLLLTFKSTHTRISTGLIKDI